MKLEHNNYEKIKQMLESPDTENIVMGMSCIENSDFKSNMTFILLMLKEANISIQDWNTHAPNTIETITNIGIDCNASLTYKMVKEIMEKYKASKTDIRLYEERFSKFVKARVTNSEHLPELLSLTVKINFKHETGSTSDSIQGPDAAGTVLRDIPDNAEQTVE